MWGKISLGFVVAVIGGTILTVPEVGAQSTVDDSASCESSTGSLDEDVNLIREELKDVKNLLGSNQQQNTAFSSLNEAVRLIKEELDDVKNLLASIQQQVNRTGISQKDLKALKAFCASNLAVFLLVILHGAGHLSRYVTNHPGQFSLVIPSLVGAMSRPSNQKTVMPCGWGVKAGGSCVGGR